MKNSGTTQLLVGLGIGLLLALPACSKGGDDDPNPGITLAAEYNLVGLRTLTKFSFPVEPNKAEQHKGGTLSLAETKKFEMSLGTNSPTKGNYSLVESGVLTFLMPQSGMASIPFQGAADTKGEALWFTDRHVIGNDVVALWPCVKKKADATLEGKWNVAIITLVHAKTGATKNPDQVALAAGGTITVDAAGAVTGTMAESSNAALIPTGKATYFKTGAMELALDWKDASTATIASSFSGAVGEEFFIGTHREAKEGGRTSLIMGVKVPATDLKIDDLNGDYLVGCLTFFANPDNPGTDAAAGYLELNGKDAFKATMHGPYTPASGFSFNGTMALGTKGLVTFEETSPVKIPIWGAAAQGGRVVLMLDKHKENSDPDLSIFIATKKPD